jgi:hypothetical protein
MKNEIVKLKALNSKCKTCSKVKELSIDLSYQKTQETQVEPRDFGTQSKLKFAPDCSQCDKYINEVTE